MVRRSHWGRTIRGEMRDLHHRSIGSCRVEYDLGMQSDRMYRAGGEP
jgi:hypothetical protein